ncbi:MAG TPA: dTMP kinase [Desulfobacteraceae bacterium]|nr:dTMP kinase [Desulfobacteraceae bacterium]
MIELSPSEEGKEGCVFISFEGIEGCGKTTQVQRLAGRLESLGIPVVMTREPGGTAIGEKIRAVLLDARNRHLSSLAELFLYAADRAQHVEEVIRPSLGEGKWVLCDRYADATTVYQGYSRGLDMDLVRMLNDTATGGVLPDITFLLDCPVNVGLGRALNRNREMELKGQDRFELERKQFHESVRAGYLKLSSTENERFILIDATLDEETMEAVIFEHIKPLLKQEKM